MGSIVTKAAAAGLKPEGCLGATFRLEPTPFAVRVQLYCYVCCRRLWALISVPLVGTIKLEDKRTLEGIRHMSEVRPPARSSTDCWNYRGSDKPTTWLGCQNLGGQSFRSRGNESPRNAMLSSELRWPFFLPIGPQAGGAFRGKPGGRDGGRLAPKTHNGIRGDSMRCLHNMGQTAPSQV